LVFFAGDLHGKERLYLHKQLLTSGEGRVE
jgi:hypothetical protein